MRWLKTYSRVKERIYGSITCIFNYYVVDV